MPSKQQAEWSNNNYGLQQNFLEIEKHEKLSLVI